MGEIEEKVKNDVKNLQDQLKDMPVNMRTFSLSMRSLYAQNAVGTNKKLAQEFRKLRDDTRDDAMVYLKCILPLSTKFVASIREYFEYYETLTYDQWCEMLKDILEETIGYRQMCEALVKMHEDILVQLKKRQDNAMTLLTNFKDLTEEFERQKQALVAKAEEKKSWAFWLAFVPYVNVIAVPVLGNAALSDLAESVAKGKEAQIQESASIIVGKVLIPALQHFVDGIKKAAGFFSVMEQELESFESKAEKSQTNPKMLYYKVMNKEAKEMKSICRIFFAVLPDVKTDFLAIPAEGTDQNYVDKWLEEHKKTIREQCKAPQMEKMLLNSIDEF